ncbi:MAG TPA: hypothetical protein VEP71_01255 [Gallionella sp.]|nr:hypothetical protein [Gallionella sp.]
MKVAVRIQQEDFFLDEEIRALQTGSKHIGGIVTFLGFSPLFLPSDLRPPRCSKAFEDA